VLIAVHGGVKVYRGSAAAARHYVEADRGRADDYYLAEGTGIAERYTASPDRAVRCEAPLTGDAYEAWVAGLNPENGEPKGRLRNDAQAVRFVEVSVNGPKSWSLAAELHPDISAAYDVAQAAAAQQIIAWLAQHATTRVGPRGGQIQVPVTEIDAVTVRHHTSRGGDPHRHIHLQINARVLAEGRWRGLHTVGVRDSIDAINGIGHAAMMTDPGFRQALAQHGFTLDPSTGEVIQLAEFVGPFSARAAQIGRHLDRYEAEWRAANPHAEPGPALRRAWDRRAWADARPDKVVPRDGVELTSRWIAELHALGYREQFGPRPVDASLVGHLDRNQVVSEVLTRLASRRSGWNAADVRGEVEQLIARANVVVDAAVRRELAEDLTARAVDACVPLIDRPGVPEHVRALTSRHVIEVETDLSTRLVRRAATAPRRPGSIATDAEAGLDPVQREVVHTLVAGADLVVIEGAAGAGKTTTLAAARTAIEQQEGRLRVATPTLKAARVAARQVGGDASSAAWLAHQHGFRWDENGTWTRLRLGDRDADTGAVFAGPRHDAVLRTGDVLLIDEAGMLDQDTARALLIIADEHHARVALVGDRHQLSAVGRGGVLDLAVRQVHPEAHRELDTVHRFARIIISPDGIVSTVPDEAYAQLSLAMRGGDDAAAVFDALLARGQISIHATDTDRVSALARHAAHTHEPGTATVVVADTNEQVRALNDAIRAELVAAGRVDDRHTTTGHASRIGSGDRVVTRRNVPGLEVANRDTWTVTGVHRDGSVTVTGERGERVLPADYVRQHLELGYASTVHGVQGETAATAHLAVGEHTGAASAYVGMTRGRNANTAHLVADSVEEAKEQWVAVFVRDRADLGPAHAAELAAREADRYARLRPLEHVLAELSDAWTIEADAQMRLEDAERRRALLRDIVAIIEQRDAALPPLRHAHDEARDAAADADARLRRVEPVVAGRAAELADTLRSEWESQRARARAAAQTVRHGTGRLGQRRAAVRDAYAHLEEWSTAWQPYMPHMPHEIGEVVDFAAWFDDAPCHHRSFEQYARTAAEQNHPDYAAARQAAQRASETKTTAWHELRATEQHYSMALQHHGSLGHVDNPAERLAAADDTVVAERATLTTARTRIATLRAEPTLRAQPPEIVELSRTEWAAEREHRAAWMAVRAAEHQHRHLGPGGRGWGGMPQNSLGEPSRGISR
jgi:conjugative relaxase-like TrwC/TraI family protein